MARSRFSHPTTALGTISPWSPNEDRNQETSRGPKAYQTQKPTFVPLPHQGQDTPFLFLLFALITKGFPGGSAGKESTCNAGDLSSIPGLGRAPGEGKGYPLQYSVLKNSMDYSPGCCKESDTTERLSRVCVCVCDSFSHDHAVLCN